MIKILNSRLSGEIDAIPSKSDAHRAIICAGFCEKETRIKIGKSSNDIDATIKCMKTLGAGFLRDGDFLTVFPTTDFSGEKTLDAFESGSTLRFLLPVAAVAFEGVTFKGAGRLPERPIGELLESLAAGGSKFSSEKLPLTILKKADDSTFEVRGDISSQYISGLLFALSIKEGGGEIVLKTPLQSAPYVDMTVNTLLKFGVKVKRTARGFSIEKGQRLKSPGVYEVEGDWSNAAFFLVAGATGGEVAINGLKADSLQGDKEIGSILKTMGAGVTVEGDTVTVFKKELNGIKIDLKDIPDALPALAIAAIAAKGDTEFLNTQRLKLKESDRIHAVLTVVRELGGDGFEKDGTLTIRGGYLPVIDAKVDSFNDHRIAMAATVGGAMIPGGITITGEKAVEKSYPDFFEDFRRLGGKIGGE